MVQKKRRRLRESCPSDVFGAVARVCRDWELQAAATQLSKQSSAGMTELDGLIATGTVVVADTGDINAIKLFKPTDATSGFGCWCGGRACGLMRCAANPSLLLAAASMPEYSALVNDAIKFGHGDLNKTLDKLAVNFGVEVWPPSEND